MQWLNNVVDELTKRHPEGEILIESGGSPSGAYHLGHIRELLISDALLLELRRRGRQARHVYFSDDLDALRKIPVNVPEEWSQYLGMPLCDVPAPDGSDVSYGDFFLNDFRKGMEDLGVEVEIDQSYKKYRAGFFVPAIEKALERIDVIREILVRVTGRQLDPNWSPIQVMEDRRLKNRKFESIDTDKKTVTYLDSEGASQTVSYQHGEVKLDWRVDWPARWWLLNVNVEPAGRDHSSSGGSFDTGREILKHVFEAPDILPLQYDFINLAGDTKKMSASKGTGISIVDVTKVLPAEVLRFFVLQYPPQKRLYFDPVDGVTKLIDEYAALSAKSDKTAAEKSLLFLATRGEEEKTISRVPFSHLVASYQASLRDADKTLEVIKRTEHGDTATEDAEIIKKELKFIDQWLDNYAPDDVKFSLVDKVDVGQFDSKQKSFMSDLADKIEEAPTDADGEWFHNAIYAFKETTGLSGRELFICIYLAIIGKTSGPRAGWFLSILPRDWLVSRLRLEK